MFLWEGHFNSFFFISGLFLVFPPKRNSTLNFNITNCVTPKQGRVIKSQSSTLYMHYIYIYSISLHKMHGGAGLGLKDKIRFDGGLVLISVGIL